MDADERGKDGFNKSYEALARFSGQNEIVIPGKRLLQEALIINKTQKICVHLR